MTFTYLVPICGFLPLLVRRGHFLCGLFELASRRHNLDGDLRDKLGRHFSPERRPSLDRSGRRVQRFSGHENPRAFEKRRDVDYRENRRYDERSDYAGSRIEVRERDERNKFLGYNNVLEEQLKDVEQDVKMLTDEKLRLEAAVERKARDADSLTSKIQELRTQLDREKEECKRITSSTKKFVKEYNRFLRAQDDVKRSEARLQKLGTQLSTYLLGNEGNDMETDIEIESDEEKNGRNLRSASDLQNELQNTSSVSRKRHYVEQYTTKESVQDALIGRREEDKVENGRSPSRWNRIPSISFSEEESRARNEEDTMNKSSSKEDTRKRRRLSSGTSSSNKVMSSTSMAARVSDEVAEFDEENTREANGSPLISLPPPPPFRNAHFHGDEETKVDVIERRKADDVDSV
ncbi:zinc finger CCCH domain-containing protein 40 isoform X2 [Raphanus sativus]|uniref:Zinc finger CCCH domain-containing protein 40 isoform X2 n=1 Tax=Raphanus sativus TaxID=3726 RepID=A0A6J0JBX3_RAPSA|nr:zinc finger CCCH domain-containing protein 40 isoform X2 [Raphanus sativus]